MRYKVTQHVPNFVEATPKQWEVNTQEEILAIPWIKQWGTERYPGSVYCLCYITGGVRPKLMVHLRGKPGGIQSQWWVLATIDDAFGLDFPNWDDLYKQDITEGLIKLPPPLPPLPCSSKKPKR